MPYRRVHLICMPYQNVTLSSLSVALLATVLREAQVDTAESYLHFDFAALVGQETYTRIAEGKLRDGFAGELFFAEDYWGHIENGPYLQLLDELFGNREARRRLAAAYRDVCLARVGEVEADLVGFTTSFNQLFPSIWLARHIKARWPDVMAVFGGAGCGVPMGRRLQETYDEVDVVVSGEGEGPLMGLARRNDAARARRNTAAGARRNTAARARPYVSLDDLPTVDYDAFMAQWQAYSGDPGRLMLAFESSRGCWWGEKQHCRFCGLNQSQITYRAKSSERVVSEVRHLWDRYGANLFATDSVLAQAHLKHAMPALAGYESRPSLFYETRANLTETQVATLKGAGVNWIQPGIESLSTPLLKLLNKGVTSLQNLALLKWCRERQVQVSWNLLCGIPGEDPAEYAAQIALISRIPHFCPPRGVVPIRIDRYSPYFQAPARYGLDGVRPYEAYSVLHPQLDADGVREIAYHFEAVRPAADGKAPSVRDYVPVLQAALADWQAAYTRGDGLFLDPQLGIVKMEDGEASIIQADAVAMTLIAASHRPTSLSRLMAAADCDQARIDELIAWGLLTREGDRALNLLVRVPQR